MGCGGGGGGGGPEAKERPGARRAGSEIHLPLETVEKQDVSDPQFEEVQGESPGMAEMAGTPGIAETCETPETCGTTETAEMSVTTETEVCVMLGT